MNSTVEVKRKDIINNLSKQLNATPDQITQSLSKLAECKTLEEAKSFDSAKSLIDAIGGVGFHLEKRRLIVEKTVDLKLKLKATDYLAFKYLERWITEDDYTAIKAERQLLRDQINEIEEQINACETLEDLEALEV